MGGSASNITNPLSLGSRMEQLIFLSENLRVSVGLFKCKRVDSSPVATNVEQNVTINRRELPTYENKKTSQKWAKTYWSLITRTKHHDSHFNIAL